MLTSSLLGEDTLLPEQELICAIVRQCIVDIRGTGKVETHDMYRDEAIRFLQSYYCIQLIALAGMEEALAVTICEGIIQEAQKTQITRKTIEYREKPKESLKMSSVYWLATYLDCKGHFGVFNRAVAIYAKSTDREKIEKAVTILGKGVKKLKIHSHAGEKAHYRDRHYFYCYGTLAIEWAMTVYPLMSTRRKRQIEVVIAYWKNKNSLLQIVEK